MNLRWTLPKLSVPAQLSRWLLIAVLLAACYVALLGLQGAGQPADTAPPPVAAAVASDAERLIEHYTGWLRAAHAQANQQGSAVPLPDQF